MWCEVLSSFHSWKAAFWRPLINYFCNILDPKNFQKHILSLWALRWTKNCYWCQLHISRLPAQSNNGGCLFWAFWRSFYILINDDIPVHHTCPISHQFLNITIAFPINSFARRNNSMSGCDQFPQSEVVIEDDLERGRGSIVLHEEERKNFYAHLEDSPPVVTISSEDARFVCFFGLESP